MNPHVSKTPNFKSGLPANYSIPPKYPSYFVHKQELSYTYIIRISAGPVCSNQHRSYLIFIPFKPSRLPLGRMHSLAIFRYLRNSGLSGPIYPRLRAGIAPFQPSWGGGIRTHSAQWQWFYRPPRLSNSGAPH